MWPELKKWEEAPCQSRWHQEGWNHEDTKEAGNRYWTNETLLWQTGRMYSLQEPRSRRKHLKMRRPKQPKPLKDPSQNVENADRGDVFSGVKHCWNQKAETWRSHKCNKSVCHPAFLWWRYLQGSLYQQRAWQRPFYLGPICRLSSCKTQLSHCFGGHVVGPPNASIVVIVDNSRFVEIQNRKTWFGKTLTDIT